MKQNDLIMRSIFDDPQNFADVMNMATGKKVIDPQYLIDSSEHNIAKIKGQHHETVPDNVKMYDYDNGLHHYLTHIILENNTYVSYDYTIHMMEEYLIRLRHDLDSLKDAHRKNRDLDSRDYIGGLKADDRIVSVAGLIVYTGKKEAELKEDVSTLYQPYDPAIKDLLLDFKARILDVHKLTDEILALAEGCIVDYFRVVRDYNDKPKLKLVMEMLSNKKTDYKIAEAIYEYIFPGRGEQMMKKYKEGEMINVGEELIFHSKEEAETIKDEGLKEGSSNTLRSVVKKMLMKGYTDEQIRDVTDCDEKQISEMRLNMNNL